METNIQQPEEDKTSAFNIFTNIFTSPQKAFQDIQTDYPVILPMLLAAVLSALAYIFLFSKIDFNWFIEHMVTLQAEDLSKAEKEDIRQKMQHLSPEAWGWLYGAAAFIGIIIIYCIKALYFVIISNINNDGFQFNQWLSFVAWASLPSIIGILASFVTLFSSTNGQIAPETLNPLTLNTLFDLNPTEGLGSILATTDIFIFWIIALMTIGYSQWTKSNTVKSFLTVVTPFTLYYAIRLLML